MEDFSIPQGILKHKHRISLCCDSYLKRRSAEIAVDNSGKDSLLLEGIIEIFSEVNSDLDNLINLVTCQVMRQMQKLRYLVSSPRECWEHCVVT